MHHLVQIWFQWVEQWGYMGIILLMAMESSIFPVPSEIVIPPAAFLATEGKLNTFGVIAAVSFAPLVRVSACLLAPFFVVGEFLYLGRGPFFFLRLQI